MEMNELEREIIELAGGIRKENLPKSVVPATLAILHSHCEKRGLRRGNLVFLSSPLTRVVNSFNPSPHRGEDRSGPGFVEANKSEGVIWHSRFPIFATLLLFFLSIPFFSFNSEPALNVIRLVLLLISLATGTALFFEPETMAGIDRKILGGRLSRIGPIATRSQEILLFRVQAVYFIMIAVFICRL